MTNTRGKIPSFASPAFTAGTGSSAKPLETALKLAFRALCADLGTMNPDYRAQELYCPFCGDTCRLSTPRMRKTFDTENGITEHILEEELVTPPDELCPNGCMKLPPQDQPAPLAVGDRVRRRPAEVYQSEGVIEEFRSAGSGPTMALVRFAGARYATHVHPDELVRV